MKNSFNVYSATALCPLLKLVKSTKLKMHSSFVCVCVGVSSHTPRMGVCVPERAITIVGHIAATKVTQASKAYVM